MEQQIARIAVVILHWKRADETLSSLSNLRHIEESVLDVVVVDNGGVELRDAEVQCAYAGATVIRNGRNLGFAGGCNVGIRWAISRGADYVLLHNDDAEMSATGLGELCQIAEDDPAIGMLGPTIYYGSKRQIVWSAGGVLDRVGRASHPNADEALVQLDALPPVCDVDYVTGCMLLVKVSVIQEVGLLDEAFFAYYEEAEWCTRARRSGFRVVWVPRASAWHNVEPHERGESPLHLYLMARNRLLYLRRIGASRFVVVSAVLDVLRTAVSWAVRPRHRARRRFSPLLLRAIVDFTLGRFGAPPSTL